jgi:hypothetical protein
MELLLNFAWVLLAALMVCAWLRFASRTTTDRRMQLVALALLLLILFPVISVTDDLQAVQNPAETDCCQRRSHLHAPVCPAFGTAATLPLPEFSGLQSFLQRISVPGRATPQVVARPELTPVSNRPPPVA